MNHLLKYINEFDLKPFSDALQQLIGKKNAEICQGRGKAYAAAFNELPAITPSAIRLDRDRIGIGQDADTSSDQKERILRMLLDLRPWRKGPFNVFGIDIDSEWDSSIKWNRLKDHISHLGGRKILDIGCSNGYYMFRMTRQKPQMVLGIDPFATFYYQFLTLNHFMCLPNIFCVPAKLEELPVMESYFNTVFCMGILYHRRSPLDSLRQIHALMAKGGELVLETLIISGDSETALCPYPRYSKMHNIYFLPTVACLTGWLKRSGFENVRCISTEITNSQEQRKTDWIISESLVDFLDPENPEKTIEGYPAPIRTLLIATAK